MSNPASGAVMTPAQIQMLHANISHHLGEIAGNFRADAKLTLIIRIPENNDADLVMTKDDLAEAIKALERSQARTATQAPAAANDPGQEA